MKILWISLLAFTLLILCACGNIKSTEFTSVVSETVKIASSNVKLPAPKLDGEKSLEQCLLERRSIREYADLPLTLEEVSQLLWAGQGVTSDWGGRTAPSAGALYPLELYMVAGNVKTLGSGIYRYKPEGHELIRVLEGDDRIKLAEAALSQDCVREAAINIVISAVYERTTGKYGERGETYVHMEAGHAAQNICLQATALNIGAVTVGAFYDSQVKEILHVTDDEMPLYIISIGKR